MKQKIHFTPSQAAGVLMFAATMLVRPSLFGEEFTYVGSVVVFAVGCMVLLLGKCEVRLLRLTVLSQGSAITLWTWLALHSYLAGVSAVFPVTAFGTVTLCCAGALLGFSNSECHDAFFASLRGYLALMGASYLVTAVLAQVVGLDTLYVGTVSVKHYAEATRMHLPFTFAYSYREVAGILLPRSGAGFREAGIAQAFYAFSILTMPRIDRLRDRVVFVLFIIGGFGALSTIGMGIVGVSALARLANVGHASKIRVNWTTIVGALLAYWAIDFGMNDKGVGLSRKLDSMSYFDRERQTMDGLAYFWAHPFGAGMYSTASPAGINLLSLLGNIGILGLVAVIGNIVASWLGSENRLQKFVAMLPLFVTGLFSQPLLDAPLVFLCYGYLAIGSSPLSEAKASVKGMPA